MIDQLIEIENNEIVEILSDPSRFESLDVDYHPPVVERIWTQYGEGRLFFHFIHPCQTNEALYHPHPWPSAMHVIEGGYEMGLGICNAPGFKELMAIRRGENTVGSWFVRESLFVRQISKQVLAPGSYYEMLDPKGWHYVRPFGSVAKTVMLTGKPWSADDLEELDVKPAQKLQKLDPSRAEEIRVWFLDYYKNKNKNNIPTRANFFQTDDELYAEHHRDDSVRLRDLLIGRGFASCGIGNAESLWSEYSDRWAAGFLGMPDDDDELYECIKDQLCVVTSVPIG